MGGDRGAAGAGSVEEFLAALRAGHHQPGGQTGSSLRLARSLYSIAHEYYRRQFPLGLGSRRDPFGEVLRSLAIGDHRGGGAGFRAGGGASGYSGIVGSAGGRRPGRFQGWRGLGRRTAAPAAAVAGTAGAAGATGTADVPAADRATFEAANRASQEIANALARGFARNLRRGRLAESLAAGAAQLAPLAVTLAPFLVAMQAQHKDADLLALAARRFLGERHPAEWAGGGGKKAWFTDTLTDVNGVAKTVRTLAGLARRRGRRLVAITCGEDVPPPDLPVVDFRPFARFPIPGYESQTLALPPLLEVLDHCERERYSEILISTPGPLGLAGLAAGKLLGIPVTGIYHTDFPLYVRHLAGSATLEQMTWTYMRWFFGSMERVFVASRCYLDLLVEHGLPRARMSLLPRGVDSGFFHPGMRDPRFYERYGIDRAAFKFLYVGRVSREKNLDALMTSFLAFLDSGRQAQLVVVGDGPYLKDLVHRYRRPEILFTGFLHGEDLARAYAGADLFVFPSTTDTFGNVVLEAQAAGLPAIVSDRGGPQEIVLPGRSGLVVDTEDPAALTAAMVRLFEDAALAAEMSARAVENARRHGWELLLERLFQAPAGVAAPPAAAGRPGAGRPAAPSSSAVTARSAAPGAPARSATPGAPAAGGRPAGLAAATVSAGAGEPGGPREERTLEMQTTIGGWHNRQS